LFLSRCARSFNHGDALATANWQWLLRWRWEAALAVCILVSVGVFALSEMVASG
jgi:hypothetical protein